MKKRFPVVLSVTFVLLLALGLAGCGSGAVQTTSRAPIATPTTTTLPTQAPLPSPTAAPTPVPTPAATPSPDGIIPGEVFEVPQGDGQPIGEYVLEHGGYLYYCDGDGLWRVDGKLKDKTSVLKTDGAVRQFFFDTDGTLYYAAEAADETHAISLYRAGSADALATGFARVFRVDGGNAYLLKYSGVSQEVICCNLASGTTSAWLNLGTAKKFRFAGGLMYFVDAHDQLYVKNMETGQSTQVFTSPLTPVYDSGDWALGFAKQDGHPVFEAYRYSDRTLRTIRLDESITRAFPTDILFNVLAFDGKHLYLCYNGYEQAATFYQVDATTGKAVKSLKADQCSAWSVSGAMCYIFTGTYSDGGAPRNMNVWACDMAGGTKTLLMKIPAKTGMVEQMAVAGGYVWGFGSLEKRLSGADGNSAGALYCTKYLFALPVTAR